MLQKNKQPVKSFQDIPKDEMNDVELKRIMRDVSLTKTELEKSIFLANALNNALELDKKLNRPFCPEGVDQATKEAEEYMDMVEDQQFKYGPDQFDR